MSRPARVVAFAQPPPHTRLVEMHRLVVDEETVILPAKPNQIREHFDALAARDEVVQRRVHDLRVGELVEDERTATRTLRAVTSS